MWQSPLALAIAVVLLTAPVPSPVQAQAGPSDTGLSESTGVGMTVNVSVGDLEVRIGVQVDSGLSLALDGSTSERHWTANATFQWKRGVGPALSTHLTTGTCSEPSRVGALYREETPTARSLDPVSFEGP